MFKYYFSFFVTLLFILEAVQFCNSIRSFCKQKNPDTCWLEGHELYLGGIAYGDGDGVNRIWVWRNPTLEGLEPC